MLSKIINANPINAGSAMGHVTQLGGIHSTDTKYQRGLVQDGQYDFNEASPIYVPVSGGVGTRVLISGVPNRQLTVDSFSIGASIASTVTFFSSGTNASPTSLTLLAGPYTSVAGSAFIGGPFRAKVGENVVVNNVAGSIGGSLVYRIE